MTLFRPTSYSETTSELKICLVYCHLTFSTDALSGVRVSSLFRSACSSYNHSSERMFVGGIDRADQLTTEGEVHRDAYIAKTSVFVWSVCTASHVVCRV